MKTPAKQEDPVDMSFMKGAAASLSAMGTAGMQADITTPENTSTT